MSTSATLEAEQPEAAITENEPSLDQWRALYKAAQSFRNVSPWAFAGETEFFGMVDPATGKTWYLSIRGAAQKPFGLIAFNGAAALAVLERLNAGLADAETATLLDYADTIPEHDYVIAAFGDRTDVVEADLQIVHALKLKFHGAREWPRFRSVSKHSVDWFITASEADVLIAALVQAVDVARRRRAQPELLAAGVNGDLLVRVSDGGIWRDERRRRELIPAATIEIPVEAAGSLLDEAKGLTKTDRVVELDYYWSDEIREDETDGRAYFVKEMMIVDPETKEIVATLDLPRAGIAAELANGLAYGAIEAGERFAGVRVRKADLAAMLAPTAAALDITVETVPLLEALGQLRRDKNLHAIKALSD